MGEEGLGVIHSHTQSRAGNGLLCFIFLSLDEEKEQRGEATAESAGKRAKRVRRV